MRYQYKLLVFIGCMLAMACQSKAEESSVPATFRKKALQQANADIADSAVSPVTVEPTSQPGYIRSTAQGNLAAYSSAESYRTFQLNETRAQLLAGPAYVAGSGVEAHDQLAVDLRYRLSPRPWPETEEAPWHIGPLPLSLFLEAGALPPTNSASLTSNQITKIDANTTDQRTLYFDYQAHFALIDELPHGSQSWVIPEVGAGFSIVSTDLKYASQIVGTVPIAPYNFPDTSIPYKDVKTRSMSPYFCFGLHLFPEHFISLNLQGSYLSFNYPDSVQIPPTTGYLGTPFPGHTLPINAPSSAWLLEAKLQMKLAWPTLTHTPLIPQMMPPWLLPAYTTDEISPWVASPQVTQRWNQPGRPSVGNVMFQYKNRWAERVEIIGEFNDWAAEQMIKDRSGIWLCVKDLPIGKFRYNYVVDGKTEILDPWNKNIDSNSRQKGSSLVVVK